MIAGNFWPRSAIDQAINSDLIKRFLVTVPKLAIRILTDQLLLFSDIIRMCNVMLGRKFNELWYLAIRTVDIYKGNILFQTQVYSKFQTIIPQYIILELIKPDVARIKWPHISDASIVRLFISITKKKKKSGTEDTTLHCITDEMTEQRVLLNPLTDWPPTRKEQPRRQLSRRFVRFLKGSGQWAVNA
jgi:hypothetical protein